MKKDSEQRFKIHEIEELARILESERSRGKRIVQCHGVFDLVHIGHIKHFEQASVLGDLLVVTITPDQYVNKGLDRPVFSQDLRAASLGALEMVDFVAINKSPTAVEAIKLLKPDVYVKGMEYSNPDNDITNNINLEEEAVIQFGGKIHFTDDEVVYSSSNLINNFMSPFPETTKEYLSKLTDMFTIEEVIQYIDNASSLKVLVVGEAIIDEYHYTEALGTSSKDPIIATRYISSQKFAGGVLAIANHMANFCSQVDVLTILGSDDSHEQFITENLNPRINPRFLYKAGAPTILKRRYVENYLLRKMFEVYVMDDRELSDSEDAELCSQLVKILPSYDVVVVADYGHGMLSESARGILSDKSAFLAVNTQANASNRGFNTVSKYGKADLASLTRYELALSERLRSGDAQDMALRLSKKMDGSGVMVTLGRDGNLCYSSDTGFIKSPALANQVLDTMGAGDSVLAFASILMAQRAPLEIIGFVANVVGSNAVATIGHSSSIERVPLYKHITTLLR